MPFSTPSEFEHSGEAQQREGSPRHVATKGGDKSIGEEKHPETVLRRARLTESWGGGGAGKKRRERKMQSGRRIADGLTKTANERV